MSKNDNILIAKEIALSEKEFFDKTTPEEMASFIEEHFKIHTHYNEGKHYCKNIKLHSVDGFTSDELSKMYDQKTLTDVWDLIILPAIHIFEREQKVHVYTKGRSGGWLYVDEARADMDLDHLLIQMEDETKSEYEDRTYTLRQRFFKLWAFEKWYNNLQKDVKEYLDNRDK
jgi:hypothetical protein